MYPIVFLGIIPPPQHIPLLTYLTHPGVWLQALYGFMLAWAVLTVAIELLSSKDDETDEPLLPPRPDTPDDEQDASVPGEWR